MDLAILDISRQVALNSFDHLRLLRGQVCPELGHENPNLDTDREGSAHRVIHSVLSSAGATDLSRVGPPGHSPAPGSTSI